MSPWQAVSDLKEKVNDFLKKFASDQHYFIKKNIHILEIRYKLLKFLNIYSELENIISDGLLLHITEYVKPHLIYYLEVVSCLMLLLLLFSHSVMFDSFDTP